MEQYSMKKHNDQSEIAIALSYDGENAPIIRAKGEDEWAMRIVEIAKQHNVLIHQDPVLTKILSQLALGEEIPEFLYVSIATIIAFAYKLNNKCPPHRKDLSS